MSVPTDVTPMTSALDHIEFLARSAHRPTVLEALAEGPQTRHDLRERADVSRITMRRLLDDFADRGWISQENGQYEATRRGQYVAREFAALSRNLDALEELGEAATWLPIEKYGFELRHLLDADVSSTNSWSDHKAAIQCVANVVEGTDRLWGMTSGFTHEVIENIVAITVDGAGSFEAVVTPSAIQIAKEDVEMWEHLRAIVSEPANDIRRYVNDDLAVIFLVGDEDVVLCGHSDHGPPPGAVETQATAVRRWLRSHFESVREEADPIDDEVLTVAAAED